MMARIEKTQQSMRQHLALGAQQRKPPGTAPWNDPLGWVTGKPEMIVFFSRKVRPHGEEA